MEKGTLTIHSENILPIIKKSLYSDKDIFIRELVSNACDAISKLKILRDQKQLDIKDEEFRIDIKLDKEKKTLIFEDTGIGMTREEVQKYIAQLAFSGAEEFLEHYKTEDEKDQIIGHFGLGFYSAFMVSHLVEINTKSYTDAPAVFFSSDGSYEYSIDEVQKEQRGTEIILNIDEDSDEFLEETKLREILQKYCSYLPYPIYLNGDRINEKEPLWLKKPSECTDEDYLSFYKSMYPFDADPIFWVHLNVDYPFNLKGILFFPKIHKRFDHTQSNIQLFCNRVFVSDNCKDLIPEHLMVLKGAIDSPDIPLNVSRSYLQMDKTVRALSSHIAKKVCDRLSSFYTHDKEKFTQSWPDIEMIIKLGCLQDEKFYERVKPFLIWKTIEGEWTTIEDYKERNAQKHENKAYYVTHEEKDSHFLDLYKQKGIEVLVASSPLDTPLMNLVESKLAPLSFQRIDGGVDDVILDKDKENTLLDQEGKTESSKIAQFIKEQIEDAKIEVEAKSLTSDALPGFIMIDEQSRRMRDYLALSQKEFPEEYEGKRTFIVNTNNVLIQAIYKLQGKNDALAKKLSNQVFELSLLGQRELKHAALPSFISRSNQILAELTSALV